MAAIQLEFWRTPEECEISALRQEMGKIKSSADKCRRSQFAKIGELRKELNETKEKLAILENGYIMLSKHIKEKLC